MARGALSGFRNKKNSRDTKGLSVGPIIPRNRLEQARIANPSTRTRFSRYSLSCNQRYLPPLTSPFCARNHEPRPENKPPNEPSIKNSHMYFLLSPKQHPHS